MFNMEIVLYKKYNKTDKLSKEKKEREMTGKIDQLFSIIATETETEISYLTWKVSRIILVSKNTKKTIHIEKQRYKDLGEKLNLNNEGFSEAHFFFRKNFPIKQIEKIIFRHQS